MWLMQANSVPVFQISALPLLIPCVALLKRPLMNISSKKIAIATYLIFLLPLVTHAELINPLGTTSIEGFIGRLIKAILGLSGSVALLMFVWGGFQYLWSGGDPKKVEKGKETLKNAVLGIVIIFFSYTLVNTIIKILATGAVT